MKNLFEYLVSMILAVVLVMVFYTLFGRAVIDVVKKTFEPAHSVQSLGTIKGEK